MYDICIDCPNLQHDGLSICCFNEACDYWNDSLKPVPVDICPLPDEEFFIDEEEDDDLFV